MALPVTITGISTAVAPVGPFKTSNNQTTIFNSSTSSADNFGLTPTQFAQIGQTFTGISSLASCTFWLWNNGGSTDSLVCDIYATSGGYPTGSPLASSNAVAGSSITTTTTGQAVTFTFPARVTGLTAGSTYAAVLRRTGSLGSPAYSIRGGSGYAGGKCVVLQNGGSWQDGGSVLDAYLLIGDEAYFFIGRDNTSSQALNAMEAADPTSSFSSVGTVNVNTVTAAIASIAAEQVGDIIHIITTWANSATSSASTYTTFDMSTGAFVVNETSKPLAAANTQTSLGGQQLAASIAVRSNGEVVVHFSGTQVANMGSSYAQTYYSRRTAVNTWSAAVQVSPGGTSDYISPGIAVGQGSPERVHFFYRNISANTGQRTLSTANVLQTASSTAVILDEIGTSFDRGSGTIRVLASSGSTVSYFDSADTPTVTNVSGPINSSQPGWVFLEGTDVWRVYQKTTDSDLYAQRSVDFGASFGTEVNIFTGTVAANAANLSHYGSSYIRDVNVVLPYIVNDNGTLKYNEYTVRYSFPDTFIDQQTRDNAISIGEADNDAARNERVAQSITVPSGTDWGISAVELNLNRSGAPSDSLNLEIRSGSQTGTLVATASNPPLGSSLLAANSAARYTYLFSPEIDLAPGTYWLVLTRSGAFSTSNFYSAGHSNTSTYADGKLTAENSNTFADYTTTDLVMKVSGHLLPLSGPPTSATDETATITDTSSSIGTFGHSVAESTTAADTNSSVAIRVGAVAETATITDTTNGSRLFVSSTAETTTATDATNAATVRVGATAETATITDATSSLMVRSGSVAESTTAIDTTDGTVVGGSQTYNESNSEILTITDTASNLGVFVGTVADGTTATDTTNAATVRVGAVAETTTATDATSALFTFAPTVAESTTATDAFSTLGVFPRSVAETTTATDATSVTGTFSLVVAETAAIADTSTVGATTYNDSVADATTATDVNNATTTRVGATADTITTTDTYDVAAVRIGATAETTTAIDTQSSLGVFGSVVAETTTATDVQSTAMVRPATVAETTTVTDTQSTVAIRAGTVAETTTATDTVTATGIFVFSASVAETAPISDSTSAVVGGVLVSVTESASITDTTNALGVFPRSVAETVTITDTASAVATRVGAVAETAVITDVQFGTLGAVVTETATATDTSSAAAIWAKAVAETATLVDACSAGFVFASSVAETAAATDVSAAASIYFKTVAETAPILDVSDAAVSTIPNFAFNIVEAPDIAHFNIHLEWLPGTPPTGPWTPVTPPGGPWSPVSDASNTWTSIRELEDA